LSYERPWVLAQDNTVAKVFFAIISYKIVFTLPQTLQMYRNVEGLTGAQAVIKT